MIHKIHIENFMSLKNVSIDLEPLTVFIGPNGSGKSAIFKALVLLSKFINGVPVRGQRGEFKTEQGTTLDDLVWNSDSGLPIRFQVWFTAQTQEDPDYALEIKKLSEGWSVTKERIRSVNGSLEVSEDEAFEHPTERRGTISHAAPMPATLRYLVTPYARDTLARPVIEPILQLSAKFGHAWRYRPSAIDIASFVQRPTERDRSLYVAENGWGVAAKLQDLHNNPDNRQVFEEIEEKLRQLFPHIQNIGFENDYQGVRLSYRTNRSYDSVRAPQESDGVLLATFLLWRLLTPDEDVVLSLEEPENGLHPLLLAGRFELLKKIANSHRQILVSTHSPEFMRALRAYPKALYKEVRTVEFTKGTGTSVNRFHHIGDAKDLHEKYLEEMTERWKPIVEGWK